MDYDFTSNLQEYGGIRYQGNALACIELPNQDYHPYFDGFYTQRAVDFAGNVYLLVWYDLKHFELGVPAHVRLLEEAEVA